MWVPAAPPNHGGMTAQFPPTTTDPTTTDPTTAGPSNAARTRPAFLPGQASVADGPLDMTMMYAMHHAFRRDLQRLTSAAEATPVQAGLAWTAMDERWQLYSLALHHHHSGEDAGHLAAAAPAREPAGDRGA